MLCVTVLYVFFFFFFKSQFLIKPHFLFMVGYCEEFMNMSLKLLDQSMLALKDSPVKNKADIQSWLSAAMTFQQACKHSADSLSLSGVYSMVQNQISMKMDYLSQLGSNPLALVNKISTGKSKMKSITRRLGVEVKQAFPKWVSARDRKLLLEAATINPNAIVATDGSGNYKTVSEAIQAASGKRFVIYVKSGFYKEKIHTNKNGITLIGDGKYSTVIVGDDSVAKGSSTPDSATFCQYYSLSLSLSFILGLRLYFLNLRNDITCLITF